MILLAEDNTLIGLILEDEFRDVGYDVAGPFTTCSAALVWLKDNSPEVAVIDANLQDEPCSELARELWKCSIPFVVYSGHSQQAAPPVFRGMPWIEKPASFDTILDAVRAVVQRKKAIQFASPAAASKINADRLR